MQLPSYSTQPVWFRLTPVILVIVMGISEYVGLILPLRRGGEWLLQPVWRSSAAFAYSLQQPFTWLEKNATLARRVQDLELRYSEALAQLSELQRLQQENEALRALIEEQPQTKQSRLITTPILSYGIPYVGVGSLAGVQEGALVLAAKTLIGTIAQVSEHQSEVRLLTHVQAQPLLARTETGVEGLVKGTGSKVVLTEVPKEATLQVGERVVTAGQKGVEPNILIGRISAITNDPATPTQMATVEQLVSFYDIQVVEVFK